MAATKTSTSGNGSSYSTDKIALCKKIINDTVTKWFSTTLGNVSNIADLHCRLLYQESGINESMYISKWNTKFILKTIFASSSVRKAFEKMGVTPSNASDITWQSHASEAALPHSVGQVMGYHFISDWPEFYIKDFDRVKTNSGGSFAVTSKFAQGAINANFQGPDALTNGIIASLVVLNQKYKASKASDPYDKIRIACQSYLGTGKDANNTTPTAYANFIMDGNTQLGVAKPSTSTQNVKVASTDSTKAAVIKPGCGSKTTATA